MAGDDVQDKLDLSLLIVAISFPMIHLLSPQKQQAGFCCVSTEQINHLTGSYSTCTVVCNVSNYCTCQNILLYPLPAVESYFLTIMLSSIVANNFKQFKVAQGLSLWSNG